jgi:hypothetical protein
MTMMPSYGGYSSSPHVRKFESLCEGVWRRIISPNSPGRMGPTRISRARFLAIWHPPGFLSSKGARPLLLSTRFLSPGFPSRKASGREGGIFLLPDPVVSVCRFSTIQGNSWKGFLEWGFFTLGFL